MQQYSIRHTNSSMRKAVSSGIKHACSSIRHTSSSMATHMHVGKEKEPRRQETGQSWGRQCPWPGRKGTEKRKRKKKICAVS